MDMYQKREMRKTKKMDENEKVYHLRVSIGIIRLLENYRQTFINKDFFHNFFLHFIVKK